MQGITWSLRTVVQHASTYYCARQVLECPAMPWVHPSQYYTTMFKTQTEDQLLGHTHTGDLREIYTCESRMTHTRGQTSEIYYTYTIHAVDTITWVPTSSTCTASTRYWHAACRANTRSHISIGTDAFNIRLTDTWEEKTYYKPINDSLLSIPRPDIVLWRLNCGNQFLSCISGNKARLWFCCMLTGCPDTSWTSLLLIKHVHCKEFLYSTPKASTCSSFL